MNPAELPHIAIAVLSGAAMAGAALKYIIRAEFDRHVYRLDKRYAPKEETERRLAHLEQKLS